MGSGPLAVSLGAVLCSLVSIATNACSYKDRHLWNPSNFGVSALLFLAPASASVLSIQWGNVIWPMVVIWILGSVIVWRVGRLHISAATSRRSLLSLVQSLVTGNPWLAISPITGPMYQLFIFFMVTDPKTTVRSKRGQVVVVFLVAVAEMILRLNSRPRAVLRAVLVGPASLIVEGLVGSRVPALRPAH